jgi:hypothetical protein
MLLKILFKRLLKWQRLLKRLLKLNGFVPRSARGIGTAGIITPSSRQQKIQIRHSRLPHLFILLLIECIRDHLSLALLNLKHPAISPVAIEIRTSLQ